MTEFQVLMKEEMVSPDNLTLPQFILDSTHPRRPLRPSESPWLIQESTGRQVYYEEVRSRVAGLANSFALDYQIRDGDVACIFTPNHIDFPIAVWASHRIGAVVSCANPSYTVSELVHVLQLSKSKVILVHPPSLSVAVEAAKQAGLSAKNIIVFNVPGESTPGGFATIDDLIVKGLRRPQGYVEPILKAEEAKTKLAFLSFSSGTTGKPKAVLIPHYAVIHNVIQTAYHSGTDHRPHDDRFTPGGVALGVLPFFHIYGLIVNIHFILFAGLSLLIVPKFSFVPFCESIKKYRVSVLFLVPPHVVLLCKHPAAKNYDWSHIKFLMSGAAPLTHELNAEIVKILPNAVVGQGYGMTETATSICWPPAGVKTCPFGSAGKIMPGVIVRIMKPDGSLGKANERGELITWSGSNALGYLDAPEATKETFVDGWVRTGDEASVDENNWVYVHDRLKELIKVRGFQVAPAELEGHLLGHPDVRDACVVGVPDEYSGELPMAFIALTEDAVQRVKQDPSASSGIKTAVAKFVADSLTKYKHLKGGVEIVDEIPKNPSGKLLRRVIREQAKALRAKQSTKAKL